MIDVKETLIKQGVLKYTYKDFYFIVKKFNNTIYIIKFFYKNEYLKKDFADDLDESKEKIIKFIKYNDKIDENAEEIFINDLFYKYNSNGSYAFGYIDGVMDTVSMWISKETGTHESELNLSYLGRIWVYEKVIAFWQYPDSKDMLKKIVSDIEKKFKFMYNKDLNIWNNGWLIKVTDVKGDDLVKYNIRSVEDWYYIPIEEYSGSFNPSKKEYIEHLKSPLRKKKNNKIPDNFGSKAYGKYNPLNKRYYHTMETKFYNFINKKR